MDEFQLIHKLMDVFRYKEEYQRNSSKLNSNLEFLLERIHFNENCTPRMLTERYGISPSTLTGQLDKLEQKSLIKRQMSSTDRRSIVLIITEKGKEIVSNHICNDKLFTDNFFSSLDQDKRSEFCSLLETLLNNITFEELFMEKNDGK